MKKRIFSTILALIMALSVIYALPMSASAATSYTRIRCGYDGTPREKVGNYYVWVSEQENYDTYVRTSTLKCKKTLGAKAKVLKTIKSKTDSIDSYVVTNGNTIYFAIHGNSSTKFYRVTVKGGTPKLIKTVKGYGDLATYYNGRLYYTVSENLMSYKIASKSTRTEKKNYMMDSGEGKYMTGVLLSSRAQQRDYGTVTQYLYNAATRKTTKLPAAPTSVVSGNKVYYWLYSNSSTMLIKSCSLSGKNIKTVKSVKPEANMGLDYFGHKVAYFKNYTTKKVKKLTYSTGKLTTLK